MVSEGCDGDIRKNKLAVYNVTAKSGNYTTKSCTKLGEHNMFTYICTNMSEQIFTQYGLRRADISCRTNPANS